MKHPQRGDKVYDHNLILNPEGVITGGVFISLEGSEVMTDCFVEFTRVQNSWYSAVELSVLWDEATQRYHIPSEL